MSGQRKVRLSGSGAPAPEGSGTPTEERYPSGQHKDYWVLSEEERAKGFVRPVRLSYTHVGPPGPRFPLRDLTPEEQERHAGRGYVKFEEYPESEAPAMGRYWTGEQLDRVDAGGCGAVTTMHHTIAETYAREPAFYGSTWCVHCGDYFAVGRDGEFVWTEDPDQRVGT